MTADALIAAWHERAARDPDLAFAARGLATRLVCRSGETARTLPLGAPPAYGAVPEITITAESETWTALLDGRRQPPGWQSFGAVLRQNPAFAIQGDPLVQAQTLAALERLFELTRPDAPWDSPEPDFDRDLTRIRGHYHQVDHDDQKLPIHALQAGTPEGPPLVFLHTAGADARQYLHQLGDTALGEAFALHAFDLPAHGGSPPAQAGPPGVLTQDFYRGVSAAFLSQVVAPTYKQQKPIVIGCSMGASMALVLAAEHPELLSGAIALEAPLQAPGRRSPYLCHAAVDSARHNPSYVRALLAPASPQRYRDEACGCYAQARPGIYDGDLTFYSEEYDGQAVAARLDGNGVPVTLLTGEYDYSSPPESTRALAALIDQAIMREMPDLGHFPMQEHPQAFRPHLLQALRDMTGRAV
ncbi:alpha/beta fold hydrolase [Fodinicurvata fenggangensis]|uniref:alpha/beta fold hydrolase n=1 Tax=Fodinicurvata fenggangensis TaxID=1121830 RepID=UPI00054D221E|nr:alpha/beta hydrolase [Fodinicurvata fenggangensis]